MEITNYEDEPFYIYIYIIRSHKTDKVYIGSTNKKNINIRLNEHKKAYLKWKNDNIKYYSSYEIIKFEDVYIELLETTIYEDALNREGYYIQTLNSINKNIVGNYQHMECKCCNYKTNRKLNYERHMVSSKHIKMEEGEKNPTKENPTIFKKRLMRENNDLKEVHKVEIEWLKEKHKIEINDLLQKLKEKDITIDILLKRLNPSTLN